MAWIESHQQLERHPKTHDLMNVMSWDLDTTVGKLHRFWWWSLDFAPSGDLRKYNDAQIGGSVGLAGSDATKFVHAMVESRWIDRGNGVFRIHDWPQYAGRYLRDTKFKRTPAKWLEVEELYATPLVLETKPVSRQSADMSDDFTDMSAVPNQPTNLPNQPSSHPKSEKEKPEVKPSDEGIAFADWFAQLLPDSVKLATNWRTAWAKEYDDMIRIDKRTDDQIRAVCRWAREDSFWKSNFMSPAKLRDKKNGIQYFDTFAERMRRGVYQKPTQGGFENAW